jgi:hypothetical protein
MSRIYVIQLPDTGNYVSLSYENNKLIGNGIGATPIEALTNIVDNEVVPTKPKKKTAVKVEASEAGSGFAKWFKEMLANNHKDIRHFDAKKWANEFDKLNRDYNGQDIYAACNFALTDNFWKDNFLTPMKLQKKNREDMKYIDVFLNKAQKQTTTTSAWDVLPTETNKEKFNFTAKLAGMSAKVSSAYSQEVMRRKQLGRLQGTFDVHWQEYKEIYIQAGGEF